MKLIAIFLAVLISTTAVAGLPPTSLKGQSGSKSTTFNFEVPHNQATKTSSGGLIETGNKNRLENPGFEHSAFLTGWTLGTLTGTATQTIGADTATPLEEGSKKSLTFQCAGGASGGTCTIYQDVTTSYVIQGRVSALIDTDVAWNGTSGARLHHRVDGATSSSLYVDISNLDPIQYNIPSLTGTTSTGIALVITAAASQTINVEIDDAYVGTDTGIADVSVITPWQSYTPTLTGFTTSSSDAQWRQVGSNVEIRGRFTLSANGSATEARISLPNSYTVSSNAIPSIIIVGTGTRSGSNAQSLFSILAEPSVSYVTIGYQASGSGALTKQNASAIEISGGSVSYQASIPIANLSGSTQVFASQCGANCENDLVARVTSGGVVTGAEFDYVASCTSAAPYTCTFKTGVFAVAPRCSASGATGNNTTLAASGETTSQVTVSSITDSGTSANSAFTLRCRKVGADYQSSRTIIGSFKDTPKTIGSSGSDIQSVYFGAGADCATACTTGTCTICQRVGTKITSVTHTGAAGAYQLNGIDGTKYSCNGAAVGANYTSINHSSASTTTYVRVVSGDGTANINTQTNSVHCIGIP